MELGDAVLEEADAVAAPEVALEVVVDAVAVLGVLDGGELEAGPEEPAPPELHAASASVAARVRDSSRGVAFTLAP